MLFIDVGLKNATTNWCKNLPKVTPRCSGVKPSHESLKGELTYNFPLITPGNFSKICSSYLLYEVEQGLKIAS